MIKNITKTALKGLDLARGVAKFVTTILKTLDLNAGISMVAIVKIMHTLSGHTDVLTKLRFTPDGHQLVSASHDHWLRVWNLHGEELRSIQPPGEVLGIGI